MAGAARMVEETMSADCFVKVLCKAGLHATAQGFFYPFLGAVATRTALVSSDPLVRKTNKATGALGARGFLLLLSRPSPCPRVGRDLQAEGPRVSLRPEARFYVPKGVRGHADATSRHEQVDVVRHHIQPLHLVAVLGANLLKQFLRRFTDRWSQHLTPTLCRPYDMITMSRRRRSL